MFRNLEAELVRRNIKKSEVAQTLGVTPSTLSVKLSGKSPINLTEVLKIKEMLGVDIPVEVLFATDEQSACREVS